MKVNKIVQHIKIDPYSVTPKYSQLINSILDAIEYGKIEKGTVLPSINELSCELEVSRDTVEKGYQYLKKIGVLGAIERKGYFIAKTDFRQKLKVLLLFNKLSAHKKIIYDSFVQELGENVAIDLYIYNNDFAFFKKILNNAKEDYSHYVIIPHFIEGGENASDIVNQIPKEKLILLDKLLPGMKGEYGAVYEDFEKDIHEALEKGRELLSKYNVIKLIFPEKSYYPQEIVQGFRYFCSRNGFKWKVISDIEYDPIEPGQAFISVLEDDLVPLIEKITATGLEIGEDIGLISYNETPLKKLILNGITTISTDFSEMGKMAARLVLENSQKHIAIPFNINIRQSL
jgi:DNA-binding transcriptional regulator YhcF (GntR family)